MLQTLHFRITGAAPLLMHNGQMANPLLDSNRPRKLLEKKRGKTDEDYLALAVREWFDGVYVDANQRLVVTADMLDACLVEGAKKSKLGKAFKSAVFVDGDALLDIGRPYGSLEELQRDPNFCDIRQVRVGTNRVSRCRPIFRTWGCTVSVQLDDTQVNADAVLQAFTDAGRYAGLGDYRPRYGRFTVAVLDEPATPKRGRKASATADSI